jgi:hypothetical protein
MKLMFMAHSVSGTLMRGNGVMQKDREFDRP